MAAAAQLSQAPMQGRVVLITGGANGLGLATARQLGALGAHVLIADVDAAAAHAAAQGIRQDVQGARVTVLPHLDLSSQASVHHFCDSLLSGSSRPPLHVLVNNAGANFMGVQPSWTDQGVAMLPQVNFLGPYTLTRRLAPLLVAGSRIVCTSSVMHRFSALPPDLHTFFSDVGESGGSYRNCKLAATVFTLMLDRLFRQTRPDLRAICADPGVSYSNLWSTSQWLGKPPGSTLIKAMFAPPSDACATLVHACADSSADSGAYYARGLFASQLVVKAPLELLTVPSCCLDWPLRQLTRGTLASSTRSTPIGAEALAAVHDGRGEALWNAAADLAGLPPWGEGSTREFSAQNWGVTPVAGGAAVSQ